MGQIHKKWAECGISASKTTTHRLFKGMDYISRIPSIKHLLNIRQHQKVNWWKEKKGWTTAQ